MAKKITFKMQPVESSHVKKIGYDKDTRTLAIEYNKPPGTVWHYSPITESAWEDLQSADSVGKWVHANLKDNPTIDASKQ